MSNFWKQAGWEEVAEMVAHQALSRRFKRFGFLSSCSGEVDFILQKQWAIEVKWAPYPTNLSKAYKKLVIPEKAVWTFSNFLKEFPSLSKLPQST